MFGALARLERRTETNLEHKPPAHQEDKRMDQAPDPADGRADKPLLEVAPHELKEQAPPVNQILEE